METQAQISESSEVEQFRKAHKVWKEANDSFHQRFEEIIARGRRRDLDALASDLIGKFEHFMECSKGFLAHVPE